jgi:zinc protease
MDIPRLLRPAAPAALAAALALAAGCMPSIGHGVDGLVPRDGRLPSDTSVVTGRLWNGLTYYIRANHEPRNRAELRLVVNAGSTLEDDDQKGLAHVVEHMAFNGTEHFAKNDLIDYLESVGMRFGPDINAYTSYDETVYMLTLPTDSAGVLDTGFEILNDWANGIAFDSMEVDKERGVVVEEWRLGRGAGARVQDRQMPVLFRRSRYAQRLPIGDPTTIRGFAPRVLKRFYNDWYRPDLMAVVAVGDFDPHEVEAQIRQQFRYLIPNPKGRTRRKFPMPRHRETQFAIAADPELTSSSVTVVHTRPARITTSVRGYREGIVESLYSGMLTERLNELTQRPDAPFLGVSSYYGSLVRPVDAYMLSAEVRDNGVERGLSSLMDEAERVARFGFTQGELDRQKATLLRTWEQIYAERAKSTSSQFAGQYAGQFLYGGPILDVATEYRLQRGLVPEVKLEEVNARARAWLRTRDRTVLVSVPEKPGTRLPDRAALAAVLDSAARRPLTAYTENVSDSALVRHPPRGGRITAERRIAEVGVTEWTLSNGVRVVMKPTDYRADEILLLGRSSGGTSLAADSDYLNAQTATAAAQVGGVGDLSVVDLEKRLAGKAASVGTDIGETSEGLSGFAAPRDAETMFQLVYLYFTAPRRDPGAWQAYRERARESLRNRGASPEAVFQDTLLKVLTRDDPRSRPIDSSVFDKIDLDRSLAIYRQRFGDAGDFTFYLVGNFHPDSIRPLVERYLGGLPSTGRKETWRDLGVRPPEGISRHVVRRGLEPRARTELVFTGPFRFSRENLALINSLGDVLQIRLRERLREDMGGTYGVGVGGSGQQEPYEGYRFVIDFGSDPERLDELTRAVFAEVERLKRDGPTPLELQKVREEQRREKEVNLRDNNYWAAQLVAYDRFGWDPAQIAAPAGAIVPLTNENIRAAAREYLNVNRYVQVSLLPENQPTATAATPAK